MNPPNRHASTAPFPRVRLALSLLLGLALPCFHAGAALGQTGNQDREEILSYDVSIQVEKDGWMEVTEEIRVRALGDAIRRGIYRDFPTSFPRQGGLGRIQAPFEVVRVLRDGRAEPYVLQSVGGPARRGGIRVRIGNANTLLEPGIYTYSLTYRTIRWIRHGETSDQLYWNVTGNGWDFPILQASAVVSLPERLSPDQATLEGWTGPEGSTGSSYTGAFDSDRGSTGAAVFRTTEPLGPREGLTVRITFPTGVVLPPTEEQRAAWFRLDWGRWLDAGLVVALVLAVYLLLWHRVGRDPGGRPIMVRYQPPEGFSPAGLGYVMERGHDNRHLTAAVVDLAVRGWLEIQRAGSSWILRRTRERPADPPPSEESLLLRRLFGETRESLAGDSRGAVAAGSEVVLKRSPDPKVRKAAKAFRADVARRLEKHYFLLNRGWFVVGLVVTLLGFASLAWRVRYAIPSDGWFMGLWLTMWTMGTGTLVWRVAGQWSAALAGHIGHWIGAVFLTLFATPFVVAEIVVSVLLWQAVPQHLFGSALVLGGVNVLFYHLLERPTLKGRGVLDEAEGFRRFLTSTEEDRIRRLQPAAASLELFERFLPWAIALGVESEWAAHFEDALAAEAARPSSTGSGFAGRPGLPWYGGDAGTSLAGLTSSLGSGLSSSLSASSAAPSSSGGGGGGGGSSGGGGGGGGGGGW